MFVLLVLCTGAFALTAAAVVFFPTALAPLDTAAQEAVLPLQAPVPLQVFLALTALGGGTGIIVLAIGFSVLTRLAPAQVLRLAFVLAAVAIACRVLKASVGRIRPETLSWFEPLPTLSFPSAHAASALALGGFIALYLSSRGRSGAAWLVLAVAVLVGMSRVVLSAHYATDVLGGFLLAGIMLALGFLVPFERMLKGYG
jgi:undecaprenyl-diphosphatase